MPKDESLITKAQAKKMVLVKNGRVHTFYNTPIMLIGGDHSKESVFKDIDKSYQCKLTGEQAQAMQHGLVVVPSKKCKQSDLLFVETKKEKEE